MAVKGKGKEVASNPSSSKRPRNASAGGSSSSAAASKRRRSGALKFVDDAAYVAEEDEDEDDSEDDLADFFDEMETEAGSAVNDAKSKGKAPVDDLRPKTRSFIPFLVKEEELSGDELEELIKERYGSSGLKYADFEDEYKDIDPPDPTKDPTIWRLKTGVGRERQVVFCFMNKFVDFHNRGNKLQIFSAFSLDHVKGFIYVEADKACDVIEACKGFYNVYPSRITAVPTNEVPQLLATRNKPNLLSKGTWVRMKTGNYKGDIAQVISVDDAKKKVMIKLVPRIDLRAISKKFGGAISLKNAQIPPPRLINPRELEVFRPHIESRRDKETGEIFEILDGNMLKNGYLFKRVALTSLIYWGVEPTELERNKFRTPDEDENEADDLEGLYQRKKKKKPMRDDVARSSSADLKASSSSLVAEDGDFEMHDLVLFGKKDFGVYLGKEKDGFYKILKGEAEGSSVVTIKRSEIKKVCPDKMFTALDKNKKNIAINDPVDVSVGPTQGKKGIVKHMYRGVLFIQNSEDETENSGFFCAKSEHCENTKKPKEIPEQSFDQNMDDNSAPNLFQSFDQQQQDNPRGRRRPEYQSEFSIGQMLRIKKGHLKGYLCRVVRIYRDNITVKLDSLVKLMTVNADCLSDPKKKGQTDGSGAAATTDIFGDQGAQDGGSSWDTGVASFTSDTWQPFGSSGTENAAGDPWGSKLPSDNSDKPSDAWGQPEGAGTSTQTGIWQTDDNASNKNTSDDPWGSNTNEKGKSAVSEEPSGWGNSETVKNPQVDDTWGSNDNKGKSVISEEPSGWGSTETVKNAQVDDAWGNKDNKGKAVISEEPSGWGNTETVKNTQVNDAWGNSDKGKTVISEEPSGWGNSETVKSAQVDDAWGSKDKGKAVVSEEPSGWGNSEAVKTAQVDNAWGSKGKGKAVVSEEPSGWGNTQKAEGETCGCGGWGSKSTGIYTK